MKIISSFMEDLPIQMGEYHAITFESSYFLSKFRLHLNSFFHRKKLLDNDFLCIVDKNNQEIKNSSFYYITFDCNVVNLTEEKNTLQTLKNLLMFHLENNPKLINEYMKFNEYVHQFISRLEMVSNDLKIEFDITEKTFSQFIQSLQINFEYKNEDYIPNYIMREFLIKSLLKLNLEEKKVFLLITFPETDIGWNDYKKFVEILKNLNVTTLVITTQEEFLTSAAEENLFLIDKNGVRYNILRLKSELSAFKITEMEDTSMICKILSIRDFKKDYFLLEKKVEEFLKSNKY